MSRFLTIVGVILLAGLALGPIAWQLITSVKPMGELMSLPPLLPSRITFEHYRAVLNDAQVFRVIGNSIIISSCACSLSVSLGALAAYALAFMQVPYTRVLLGSVLLVSMLPGISIISPLYLLISAFELRDTKTALILLNTSFSLPLSIWIIYGACKAVPDELFRSAKVDGCSDFQTFYKVILPLLLPGIAAAGALSFLFCWNEFLFALTFSATSASRTIPVGIALFPGLHEIPWGEIAALSAIATFPVAMLVFVFQRAIMAGLTSGAVKG